MNIVQIGCHTGEDHVYDFISKNSCDKAILIDANPYVLDICELKYKNINNVTFLNYAIVPEYSNNSKFIKFYIPQKDKISAHCSLSLDFIKKHNHEQWIEEEIPCMTLNELFLETNLVGKRIDRLYIDAEGLDSQIILSLDLSKTNIEYIYFEHMHSDGAFSHGPNLKKVIDKLQQNNYTLKNQDMYNLGFERIEKS